MIPDSCIWVALADGSVEAADVIDRAGDAPVFISAISLGELWFGVEACANPSKRAACAAFMQQVATRPVLPVTAPTAAAFGLLAAAVKRSGRSPRPRDNDLRIAAQAIERGYRLLTVKA